MGGGQAPQSSYCTQVYTCVKSSVFGADARSRAVAVCGRSWDRRDDRARARAVHAPPLVGDHRGNGVRRHRPRREVAAAAPAMHHRLVRRSRALPRRRPRRMLTLMRRLVLMLMLMLVLMLLMLMLVLMLLLVMMLLLVLVVLVVLVVL